MKTTMSVKTSTFKRMLNQLTNILKNVVNDVKRGFKPSKKARFKEITEYLQSDFNPLNELADQVNEDVRDLQSDVSTLQKVTQYLNKEYRSNAMTQDEIVMEIAQQVENATASIKSPTIKSVELERDFLRLALKLQPCYDKTNMNDLYITAEEQKLIINAINKLIKS